MLTVQGSRRPEFLLFKYFPSNHADTWVVTSTSKQEVEASEVSLWQVGKGNLLSVQGPRAVDQLHGGLRQHPLMVL